MSIYPTNLELVPDGRIFVIWSDGQRRSYTVRQLRDGCPCASCREQRTQSEKHPPALLPVLSPEEIQPLSIQGMTPVGRYAYNVSFSDGHNTGIYPLELLRRLGTEERSTGE